MIKKKLITNTQQNHTVWIFWNEWIWRSHYMV